MASSQRRFKKPVRPYGPRRFPRPRGSREAWEHRIVSYAMSLALRWMYADYWAGAPHDPATFVEVLLEHIEAEGRALGLVRGAYDVGPGSGGSVLGDDDLARKVRTGMAQAVRDFDPERYREEHAEMGRNGTRGKSYTVEMVEPLLDAGKTPREVAEALGCDLKTVRRRVADIRARRAAEQAERDGKRAEERERRAARDRELARLLDDLLDD